MNRHRWFSMLALAVLALVGLLALGGAEEAVAYASPLPQAGDNATLRVINESGETICYVLVCPPGAEDAEDCPLVAETTIAPGDTHDFEVAAGDYTVGLVDCEGNVLLAEGGFPLTDEYELRFTGTTDAQTAPDCDTLFDEGINLYTRSQFQAAITQWESALTCYREENDAEGESNTLINLGSAYAYLSQYPEATGYYEQVLVIAHRENNQFLEMHALLGLGVICNFHSQYQESIVYYEQALPLARAVEDRKTESGILGNLGVSYSQLGEYQNAIEYFEQALVLAQEANDSLMGSGVLINLGIAYHYLGQYEDAINYQKEALGVLRDLGDQVALSKVLNNIGSAYTWQRQYIDAIPYYMEALSIREEIGDLNGQCTTLMNMGILYHGLGNYEESLSYNERALNICQRINNHTREATVLYEIGRTHSTLRQYEEALIFYEKALTISVEVEDLVTENTIHNALGYVHLYREDFEVALIHFQKSVSITEDLRGAVSIDEWKTGFTAKNLQPYRGIVRALHSLDRPDEAFHYAQRAKSRTFLDQIGNVRVDPRATDDPKLIEQEQTLLTEIRGLEAVLSGQQDFETLNTRGGGPNTLTNEQRNEVRIRLDDAYREYEHLLAQIKLSNPAYADLRTVDASTLITVQQTLPAETTLVEYYVVSDTQMLAFVVTPDAFHTVPLSVSVEALDQKIDWFRQFTSEEESRATAQLLYDWLFAPVREYIDTRAVLIAPHQRLHYLPLDTLHDGERYLVETYAIGYLPSASVLRYLNAESQRRRDAEDALVLGNPENPEVSGLPGAEAEARAVAGLFGVSPYLNAEATESRLWDEITGTHYVHVAAHGAFNATAPQFSRLYLTPSEAGDAADEDALSSRADGLLETREVWNLPLEDADLVTLSACQTQLGDLSAGDELVGLSRAFIYAGTPSLVASLWSVEDRSTAYLMERFYGYLQDGMSKGEALRQAKLDTMAEYPSPYHWAAFTLIGDMGAVSTGAPDDADGCGGICPGMALPLALGAVAWYEDQRQRRRG